jgi:hypothetical protein
MDTLLKDLRYGLRSLWRQPAFTSVAVLTLALGIGANSAIFSIINTLILTPPAIAEPDRVVSIWQTPANARKEGYVSYLDLQDWQTRNQTFEEIAGYKPNGLVLLNNGEAEQIQGMRITANFLPLLKVTPVLGRNFERDEELRNSQRVALIGYDFWQTRFGGDTNVLNRQQSLNGEEFTIIGVLPQHFEFPLVSKDVEVVTTVAGESGNLKERGAHVLRVVGPTQAECQSRSCAE